ncbi:translation regulator [Colletotrichum truncatum]|uniref:Translation regulator n=1 Tax=Colletotrichum truncatum TaxID=5467 RepID=A0ACC3YMP1_COLTU|nr:translation regulator [Colletotrichum truncatum]KAF6792247.1 translation regulator [Colletotrichum truncatum]
MLEKTVATLESCTSLHALPSATHSLRSRRKLHTGFWQHGAAAIDIHSSALFTQPNEPELSAFRSSSTPAESLAASTFLLDFLYPNGAAALMRRLAPGSKDNQTSSIQRLPRRSRLFTSSAAIAPAQILHSDTADILSRASNPQMVVDGEHANVSLRREIDQLDIAEVEEAERDTITDDQIETDSVEGTGGVSGTQTHSGPSFAGAGSRPELMKDLMATKDTEYFGSIWQLYSQLEPQLKPQFRPEVIAYLYRSANLLDARRVILLSSELQDDQWSSSVLTSVVNAHLRLGNESEALSLYLSGLSERTIVGGLDDLLHFGFKNENWEIINRVWASYHAVFKVHGIKSGELERLAALPRLGELTIQFAKEARSKDDNQSRVLNVLLKKAARRALQQPCKPEEALPLLKIVDQVKWYNIYLSEAIDRGQRECLPEIYRIYRAFPGVKPYWGILHGMFEIFYPHDVAGLEQVYEDYHVSYQKLDQWGFKKFLKFYASRGDTKSLERLWDDYVQAYKHRKVLQEPETFNQILNAYATKGDAQGARRVFDQMTSRFGVNPSLYSWNILLKSHVRSKSYDSAMSLFDELCSAVAPDSFSFATIMSLTASNGDLDKTLELLQRAGKKRVKIDVPIMHAVVQAYCENRLYSEALATCVNAKKQGIPGVHANLWNTLLRYHSERRAFGAVCRVVTIMGKYKIDWTSNTHDVLLQALVRCRQTHHAYDLLRKARRYKTFALAPEHFSTVMDGGLRTRELGLVDATDRMRERTGTPRTINATILLVDAMVRRQLYGRRAMRQDDAGRELLASYLQEMIDAIQASETKDSNGSAYHRGSVRSADSLHRLRLTLPRAISLFARYRDFEMVKELYRLQTGLGLQAAVPLTKGMPFEMLCILLKENVQEKKYDAAKSNWELIWQNALRIAFPEKYKGQQALPRHSFILSGPIKTMRTMYMDQKDPEGFKTIVNEALAAGFKFDRRAMNSICHALADMGFWMEAAELCEKYLMPNFTGWQMTRRKRHLRKNLPLEKRRIGSAPQWLRPTSYTLVALAKEYMEMKSASPWSSAAAEKARTAKERFPLVVAAIDSIKYSGVGIESEVFGHRYGNLQSVRQDEQEPEGEKEEQEDRKSE